MFTLRMDSQLIGKGAAVGLRFTLCNRSVFGLGIGRTLEFVCFFPPILGAEILTNIRLIRSRVLDQALIEMNSVKSA